MTHISPRVAQDTETNFARMHRAQDTAALRRAAIEITCALGLVILAAAAGYLANAPQSCADAVGWVIETD